MLWEFNNSNNGTRGVNSRHRTPKIWRVTDLRPDYQPRPASKPWRNLDNVARSTDEVSVFGTATVAKIKTIQTGLSTPNATSVRPYTIMARNSPARARPFPDRSDDVPVSGNYEDGEQPDPRPQEHLAARQRPTVWRVTRSRRAT